MLDYTKLIENNTKKSMLVHVIISVLANWSKFILVFYVYITIYYFFAHLRKCNTNNDKGLHYLKFCCYLGGLEMISRIIGCSPFIPYELTKYAYVFIVLVGVLGKRFFTYKYIILLVLLLLSLIFDYFVSADLVPFEKYVFNYFGVLCVALFFLFFVDVEIFKLRPILNALLMPIIMVFVYCLMNVSSLDFSNASRNANEMVTGGFGSNQVSTVFGVGAFVIFLFIYNKWVFSGMRWVDFFLFSGLTLMGLLSFSRGGMIVGFIAIFIYLYNVGVFRNASRFLLMILGIFVVLIMANNLTNGKLLDRYTGKTEGVIAGSKDVTLNNLSTGRFNIFLEDIELWKANLLFGVGISKSPDLRRNSDEIAHVEFSRLVAEQGVFGFVFFLLWVLFGLQQIKSQKFLLGRTLTMSFFCVAILTTFHAGMRTFVSPLFTCLTIVNYKIKKI